MDGDQVALVKSYHIPVSHRPNIYHEWELRRAVSQPRASGVFLCPKKSRMCQRVEGARKGDEEMRSLPPRPLPSPPPPLAPQLRNHFISSG